VGIGSQRACSGLRIELLLGQVAARSRWTFLWSLTSSTLIVCNILVCNRNVTARLDDGQCLSFGWLPSLVEGQSTGHGYFGGKWLCLWVAARIVGSGGSMPMVLFVAKGRCGTAMPLLSSGNDSAMAELVMGTALGRCSLASGGGTVNLLFSICLIAVEIAASAD